MIPDVKIEISRGAVGRGLTVDAAIGGIVGRSASELSTTTKARVRDHGDLAGQTFPGWRQRTRRRYAVSPRYPDRAVGQVGPSGAEWFESRPGYQRENATRPGTYATTGGMWAGLSIVFSGRFYARIAFRGRSEGASPNFTRRSKAGRARIVVRPLKINNALKASTVLRQHGINVLALTEKQLERVAVVAVETIGVGMGTHLPIAWDRAPSLPRPVQS